MSHTFLEAVLPSSGRYCVVAIDDKAKTIRKQSFVDSLDEIIDQSNTLERNQLGSFFALATFDSDSRKAANAAALRSVFIDIDAGAGKPYEDVSAAAQALKAFLKEHHLPTPIVVVSGGGIHAYWTFTEDVPVATWFPVADAFKKLCLKSGLAIDPTVTSDAARVLRLPGSHNFKQDTPRQVQVMTMGAGPVEFELFTKLVPVAPTASGLDAAKQFGLDAESRALAGGNLKPAKFRRLLQRSMGETGCAQVRNAVENSDTLEEPLWRAALSIAWNCVDGARAIHKISEAHPDYKPEDTQEKAERLTGKPYTCVWFKENYPAHCQGCTHKISSPIMLGVEIEEAPVSEDGDYVVTAALNPDNEVVQTEVEVRIPQYPYPYFRGTNGGVFKKDQDADGNPVELEIYHYDLYVTNRYYDSTEHGDGEGELVNIHLHLPHDGIRRFQTPVVNILAKDKLRDVLVKHGVVTYGKQLDNIMAYLASSIRKLQSSFASNKTRSQMGWTPENTFVVGGFEYTPSGVKLAPPASSTKDLAPKLHSKGTLEGWREVINFYNRPGMEAHAFGFLVGMGSCLLKLLNNTQVRGAVLNLVSNGSGTGKTTLQLAINSLFGQPRELLMEAKDTAASRFQILGTYNSLCLTVDEVTNIPGDQLSALVYGSTSGRAPHRMEAQTNKLRNNHTTWCSVTVTSSNAVMADVLAAHKTAVEAELKRVIDWPIVVTEHIAKEESDALFTQLAFNYGVAGPIFAQHIVANRESIEQTLKELQIKIDNEAGFERNDRFYSAVCAVAFGAALIGNKLGLFELDIARIYAFAIKKIKEIKENNAATVGSQATMAVETLAKFINENINNTLVIHKAGSGELAAPTTSPKGKLVMRYDVGDDELVILASDLRAYFVERRIDFKASLHEFHRMGALRPNAKTGELAVVRRIASGAVGGLQMPAARCYVFSGKSLGVDIHVPEETTDD